MNTSHLLVKPWQNNIQSFVIDLHRGSVRRGMQEIVLKGPLEEFSTIFDAHKPRL